MKRFTVRSNDFFITVEKLYVELYSLILESFISMKISNKIKKRREKEVEIRIKNTRWTTKMLHACTLIAF